MLYIKDRIHRNSAQEAIWISLLALEVSQNLMRDFMVNLLSLNEDVLVCSLSL